MIPREKVSDNSTIPAFPRSQRTGLTRILYRPARYPFGNVADTAVMKPKGIEHSSVENLHKPTISRFILAGHRAPRFGGENSIPILD